MILDRQFLVRWVHLGWLDAMECLESRAIKENVDLLVLQETAQMELLGLMAILVTVVTRVRVDSLDVMGFLASQDLKVR